MIDSTVLTDTERIKELLKRKNKLMASIRRSAKVAVKARLEKRKVNEELRRLRVKANVFVNMTTAQAQAEVRRRIEGVNPADAYPKDLEKSFDKMESAPSKDNKVVDLGGVSDRHVSGARARRVEAEDGDTIEDASDAFIQEDEDEVIDLSDQ